MGKNQSGGKGMFGGSVLVGVVIVGSVGKTSHFEKE